MHSPHSSCLTGYQACISLLIGWLLSSCLATTVLPASSTAVFTITDENWQQILDGEWMVKFYAPWCPACRALKQTWADVGAWSKSQDLSIGSVDVTQQIALNGRFLISSLPTIYHIRDGEFRVYDGQRDVTDFTTFVTEKKWEKIDPVAAWKSPTGMLMGGVANIYGFSIHLKNWHDQLQGTHGLPQWLIIILFGVAIITLGLILGFLMVFIGDWLWPENEYELMQRQLEKMTAAKKKKDDEVTKDDDQAVEEEEVTNDGTNEDNEESGVRQRKVKSEDVD